MHSMLWILNRRGLLVTGVAAATAAQERQPNYSSPLVLPGHRYDLPATLITAAQIEAHKKSMIAAKDDDVPMNMVKAGGGSDRHQVGVSVVTRSKGQRNPNYAVHDDVAEVYYVLEGKGHMKLGGKITDWKRRPVSAGNGRGSGGTTAVGAKDIAIAKGTSSSSRREHPTSGKTPMSSRATSSSVSIPTAWRR